MSSLWERLSKKRRRDIDIGELPLEYLISAIQDLMRNGLAEDIRRMDTLRGMEASRAVVSIAARPDGGILMADEIGLLSKEGDAALLGPVIRQLVSAEVDGIPFAVTERCPGGVRGLFYGHLLHDDLVLPFLPKITRYVVRDFIESMWPELVRKEIEGQNGPIGWGGHVVIHLIRVAGIGFRFSVGYAPNNLIISRAFEPYPDLSLLLASCDRRTEMSVLAIESVTFFTYGAIVPRSHEGRTVTREFVEAGIDPSPKGGETP